MSQQHFAAKAKNDGYTLLVNADSAQVINPALYAKTGFDPVKDFDPIAPLAKSKPGALSIASAWFASHSKAHPTSWHKL